MNESVLTVLTLPGDTDGPVTPNRTTRHHSRAPDWRPCVRNDCESQQRVSSRLHGNPTRSVRNFLLARLLEDPMGKRFDRLACLLFVCQVSESART
jgi:hypothetical protein